MINYGAIYRPRDEDILCQISLGPKNYKKDLKKALKKLRTSPFNPGERMRFHSKAFKAAWWTQCD